MAHENVNSSTTARGGGTDPAWRGFYRAAGIAALINTGLFLTDIIVLTTGNALPGSGHDWLTLFQGDRLGGLLELFFTDLFGVALTAPILFALYGALRARHPAYAGFATAIAFVGIAIVLGTNANYSLLYLSTSYSEAASPAERSQILAAVEAVYSLGNGTGPLMATLLLEGAMLILSVLMLRDPAFGKGIGWLGIAAHGLDVAHSIVFLALFPFLDAEVVGAISTPLLAVGGTLQLVWYPLLALRLLRLGARTPIERSGRAAPAEA